MGRCLFFKKAVADWLWVSTGHSHFLDKTNNQMTAKSISICFCLSVHKYTSKHILPVSSWVDEWPEVELPVKDSLGTGSLAQTYTHIYFFFFLYFQCVFVLSLCCDQARPPAGDLGRGGAVLEERKREKRGMLLLWEAGERKRGTVCD